MEEDSVFDDYEIVLTPDRYRVRPREWVILCALFAWIASALCIGSWAIVRFVWSLVVLCLVFTGITHAQYVLDYQGELLTPSASSGSSPPTLGFLMGEVTLAAALQEGTQTVTPLAFAFSPTGTSSFMNSGFLDYVDSPFNAQGSASASFTYTVLDGVMQGWDIELTAINGPANREYLTMNSAGAAYSLLSDNDCPVNPDCYAISASAGPGTWQKAPEIAGGGWVSSLTLLAGLLAVARGRRVDSAREGRHG